MMNRLREHPRNEETKEGSAVVTLEDDRLVFRIAQVHEQAEFTLEFQRTLRIPDDGRRHFLPPGLGRFPLELVDDFSDKTPPLVRLLRRRPDGPEGAKKLANLDSVTARRIREGRVVRQEGPLGPVLVNPLY